MPDQAEEWLGIAFYRQVRASAHMADAEEPLATMLSSN